MIQSYAAWLETLTTLVHEQDHTPEDLDDYSLTAWYYDGWSPEDAADFIAGDAPAEPGLALDTASYMERNTQ